jgi:WhiB family redox-sensing transcriptional regulator
VNLTIHGAHGTTEQAPGYTAVGALRQYWAGDALCLTVDLDAMFVRGAAQQGAKAICQRCPVIAECLADALDNRTEFGVWGGMTERERRTFLLQHPNVPSWWSLFQSARATQAHVS